MPESLSRRGFVGAVGTTGLAAAGLTSLAGCKSVSTASSADDGAKASAALKLPTYVPAKTAPADLPGNSAGLDAAYLRYPKDLATSVTGVPGDGSKITALTETFTTPAPAQGKNGYWQELNKRLGSQFDMTITVDEGDGYPGKFNAIIASGDIPDLVWFPPNQGLQHVPELLDAKFHDLTPHLSGDAVKKYPNLANLPTTAWQTAVIDGKIRGVTVAYGSMGQVYVVNQDFWKPVGGATFTSAEDFLAKGKDLLDAKRGKYVLEPAYVNHVAMFAQWFGAPVGWRPAGGKLTNMWETEEYQEALAFGIKVAKAGLFWPDPDLSTTMEKMAQGDLGAYVQSFPGFLVDVKTYDFPFGVIVPFAAKAGATPKYTMGYGSVGYTAISKKADPARVEMLLRVLDYLSAPFGTVERMFLDNGIEGVHYTRTAAGDIKLTDKGNAEAVTTAMPLTFLANGPEYVYTPGKPDITRQIHDWQQELLKISGTNPTNGHFSDTSANKGGSLSTTMNDGITDIVAGRKPLSAFQGLLRDWRSGGGDKIRAEFEASIAAK
jgi:putative aldouronate transport system substrate-binding protein